MMTMIMEDENGSTQKGALNNNNNNSSSTTINPQQQQQSMIFSSNDQHNNNSSIQLSTSSMNNDIRWAFSQIKGPLDEEVAEGMNMKNFKNFSYNQIFSKTADIISCVEFSHDGELLATGDKGGRVVIFQRDPFVIIILKKFFLQVC